MMEFTPFVYAKVFIFVAFFIFDQSTIHDPYLGLLLFNCLILWWSCSSPKLGHKAGALHPI